jgi:hypothetical protein
MKSLVFVVIICLLATSSCKKDKDTLWVYYDETFCSDAWGDSDELEPIKKNNIKAYLKNNNVEVFEIKFSKFFPEEGYCKSCGCRSGVRIESKIKARDLDKALSFRFYQ